MTDRVQPAIASSARSVSKASISARFAPPPIVTGANGQALTLARSRLHSLSNGHLPVPGPGPPLEAAPLSPVSPLALPVLHSGYLRKKSPTSLLYDRRYFTLTAAYLSYCAKPSDRFPLAYLRLTEIVSVSVSSNNNIELGLTNDSRYRLRCDSSEESEQWRSAIERAVVDSKNGGGIHRRSSSVTSQTSSQEVQSPRTPQSLKNLPYTYASDWKDAESSQLERAFFTLIFSGKRAPVLTKSLMDVRSNLDILRFCLELLLDTSEAKTFARNVIINSNDEPSNSYGAQSVQRRATVQSREPRAHIAPVPVASPTASLPASTPQSNGTSSVTIIDTHAPLVTGTLNGDSVSHATSPSHTIKTTLRIDRSASVAQLSNLGQKMRLIAEKLASIASTVQSLSDEDKAMLVDWTLSSETLASIQSLITVPNTSLHDRAIRLLYLIAIIAVTRDTSAGNSTNTEHSIASKFSLSIKSFFSNCQNPAVLLQCCQSLLVASVTPLSLFAQPVFASQSLTLDASIVIHNHCMLQSLFLTLSHSDFHFRRKALKEFLFLLSANSDNKNAFLFVPQWQLLLTLMIADIPMRAKRKHGVVKKVYEYAMRIFAVMHQHCFDARPIKDNRMPSFREVFHRSLLIASQCVPLHYHAIARAFLNDLVSALTVSVRRSFKIIVAKHSSYTQQANGASQSSLQSSLDSVALINLLHLVTLIKAFVFVPARFRQLIDTARAESVASEHSSDNAMEMFASSSSQSLTSGSTDCVIDWNLLFSLSFSPLPFERASTSASAITVSDTSDFHACMTNSQSPSLYDGSLDYDVHRFEKRGMKLDSELLSSAIKLLTAILSLSPTIQSYGHYSNTKTKAVIRIYDRLVMEVTLVQDAQVFLLLLAPMVSTAIPSVNRQQRTSISSMLAASTPFTSSLLTPGETSNVIQEFLLAKHINRRKVFRRYEQAHKLRELSENREAESRSKLIEASMIRDAEREARVCKLLLLGCNMSGKSTLVKQIRCVYGSGFNAIDRQHYIVIILLNLVQSMQSLIYHSDNLLQRFPFSVLSNHTGHSSTAISQEAKNSINFILNFQLLEHFPSLTVNASGRVIPQSLPATQRSVVTCQSFHELLTLTLDHLLTLWADRGVQLTYENRSLFDRQQLNDNDGYFFCKMTEMRDIRWTPNEEDIVRVHSNNDSVSGSGGGVGSSPITSTSNVSVYDWHDTSSSQYYRMTHVNTTTDNDRKKWLTHYFNDITVLVYIVGLSDFDRCCEDDVSVNRLHDSLQYWSLILSLPVFEHIPIILLFNKYDLFREKLQKGVSLRIAFPKYRGSESSESESFSYITNEFLKRARSGDSCGGQSQTQTSGRPVYCHCVSTITADGAKVLVSGIQEILDAKKRGEPAENGIPVPPR